MVVLNAHTPSTWERKVDLWVRSQPDIQNKFRDTQGYTKKPCLKDPNNYYKYKYRARKNLNTKTGWSISKAVNEVL